MIKLKNKFAIGCLVQWYEIEIIEEYINSVKKALKQVDNTENVLVDFTFTTNQKLETIMTTSEQLFYGIIKNSIKKS